MIPQPPPTKNGRTGWPPIKDWAALEKILFMAEAGIVCEKLPPEVSFNSAVICWHRLQVCQEAGAWEKFPTPCSRSLARTARSTGRRTVYTP